MEALYSSLFQKIPVIYQKMKTAKPKIIVHCLVANEERFIWYALQSVIRFVDKIMVWDTGSVDKTLEIIKAIKSAKIEFKELGPVTADRHTQLRQEMLSATDKTKYDWLMILDGDEIWPSKQLQQVGEYLSSHPKMGAVVVYTKNFVGDIYHQMPQSAGRYNFGGKTGHLGLRFINLKLPKLNIEHPHGGQTYTTNNMPLQDLDSEKLVVLDKYYFHATHLSRSTFDSTTLKRSFKRRLELGERVDKSSLPEVFFSNHPAIVPNVTQPMDLITNLKCIIFTIPRRIKRYILPVKHGYI